MSRSCSGRWCGSWRRRGRRLLLLQRIHPRGQRLYLLPKRLPLRLELRGQIRLRRRDRLAVIPASAHRRRLFHLPARMLPHPIQPAPQSREK